MSMNDKKQRAIKQRASLIALIRKIKLSFQDKIWNLCLDQIFDLPGVCTVGMIDGDDPYLSVIIRNESFRNGIPETIQGIKVNIVVNN